MADMPEQDELVLATVKKIMPYGAFCSLDEYGGRESFVHISEVAPRWIKNIHEFLRDGQKLVAKVYHLDLEKGQIDLSLKRVTESEKKAKVEGNRREKRADKLFEVALKIAKSTKSEEIAARNALVDKHGSLIDSIEALSEQGEAAIAGLKIEKGLGKALLEVASKSMKKARAEVNGIFSLTVFSPDGVEAVRRIFSSVKKPSGADVEFLYLGAPRYQIRVVADDFKSADKALDDIVEALTSAAKPFPSSAEFSKIEA
ncbi:MAG: S1 RNA-binding domain-containing protein [Candidatus Micrarchaeia archaeon]|jgi:translation initiation factor 2 subunit 1